MVAKFWHLDSPDSIKGLAEWVGEEIDLGEISCKQNPGHQRAGKRLYNLSIKRVRSKKVGHQVIMLQPSDYLLYHEVD